METLKLLANDILDRRTQMHYNILNQIENTLEKHSHDFFEMFLIINGNAVHHVNGTEQLLHKGAVVFVRPGDTHYYEKYDAGNCQFINIAFSQDVLKDFFNYLGDDTLPDRLLTCPFPPWKQLDLPDMDAARKKLEGLAVLPREDKTRIRSYLRLLLADFIFNYFTEDPAVNQDMPAWLARIGNEMKKKENFSAGLPVLLKLSGKSPEYVSRVFKKSLGVTPTDYINVLRLNYTANMLEFSDADISDIVLDAGFNNLSHFYHLFKKRYGLSPGRYRKSRQLSAYFRPMKTKA